MDTNNFQKLKTRLSGAIWNAINKDETITYSHLKKAFFEVCHRLIMRNRLINDLEWEMPEIKMAPNPEPEQETLVSKEGNIG